MTERSTGTLPPPGDDGGNEGVFQSGGLLAPLLEAGLFEEVREIVLTFLASYREVSVAMEDAVGKAELERCAETAHSLIGSAGGLGATGLSDGLAHLESTCRAGDLQGAISAWTVLKKEEERVIPLIRQLVFDGFERR